MKKCGRIKHFQTDDPPVLPVENNHRMYAFGWIDRDAVTARRQRLVSQVDVRSVGFMVIGHAHAGDGIAW